MLKKSLILAIFIVLSAPFISLYAEANVVLSDGEMNIPVDLIDPVHYEMSGYTLEKDFDSTMLFTPNWPKKSLSIDEGVLVTFNQSFEVIDINEESASIPINGSILYLPKSFEESLSVDQSFTVNTKAFYPEFEGVFESQDKRVLLTGLNETRQSGNIIYYDTLYGSTTKTSRLGTEIIVAKVDDEFIVSDFRPLASGTKQGSMIPSNGFVISAQGSPEQLKLMEGYLFEKGDSVNYINVDILKTQTYEYSIDAIDPTLETHPSGEGGLSLRGADQLIIYTDAWQNTRNDAYTGTNAYGHEVSVNQENLVESMDTNVKILDQGFVVSGHGEAARFLRDHVEYGSLITHDGETITVENNRFNTSHASANKAYELIDALYTHKTEGLFDIDYESASSLKQKVDETMHAIEMIYQKDDIDEKSATKLYQHYASLDSNITKLRYALMVSHTIDARAMWHRPNEHNLNEIIEHLDLWESLGFNIIYVETLWTGYVNHQSDYLDMHPDILGNTYGEYGQDYLKAFIDEAHKRNIEVHAWNEIFFSGSTARPLSNMLSDNPSWHMLNHDGTNVQNSTYFSDPANPEVIQFLKDYHHELFSNYDLDGMQFDYIRYPSLNPSTHPNTRSDSGYTEVAIERFKDGYDIEGDIKALVESDNDIYEQFAQFRRDLVTEALIDIRTIVLNANPDVEISMAIAPEPDEAFNRYYQEWPRWIKEGYIDHIAPMIYHGDYNVVASRAKVVQGFLENKTMQYTGIAPVYFGYTALDNQLQIESTRSIGAQGYAIFAAHNVTGDQTQEEALKHSTNRLKAVTPHDSMEKIIDKFIQTQTRKLEMIYLENEAVIDEVRFRLMLEDLDSIETNHAKDYQLLVDQLEIINAYKDTFYESNAASRLEEDIAFLINLIDIRISRDLIDRDLWDPSNEERPTVTSLNFDEANDESNDPIDDEKSGPVFAEDDTSTNWQFITIYIAGVVSIILGIITFKLSIKKG